jgi:hypothetical protein
MAVETQTAGARPFPRLHWSAVLAGVFVAIAGHIVLGLVGAALGLAAEPADSEGVGAAAAIWALVTPFVATLLGAWLACRMAGAADERAANVHGVLVWCIGLVAGALFLTGTLATGAMTAGTAASGNLGPAQRFMGGEPARTPRSAEVRTEEAARRAAAGAGGAALAAIAGLLGAVVGAGLSSRRSRGRGFGWRLAIERREEAHAGRGGAPGHERHAGPATYGGAAPRAPGAPDAGPPPVDPYHH